MNILLIEDDPVTLYNLSEALRADNHQVDVASDGAEGLDLITSGRWDIVIIDRVLPKLDGLSLVRVMRYKDAETPVLFMSAMASVRDRLQGLEAGGDDYLVKPFRFLELKERVEALGRLRRCSPIY